MTEWRVADNFWDLRDDTYDHPKRWEGATPIDIFQRLSEVVQEAEEQGPIDWWAVSQRMIAWRVDETAAAPGPERPDDTLG